MQGDARISRFRRRKGVGASPGVVSRLSRTLWSPSLAIEGSESSAGAALQRLLIVAVGLAAVLAAMP